MRTQTFALGMIGGLLAAAFAAPVSAALTWNFDSGSPICSNAGSGDTNSRTCNTTANTTPTVTGTGYANTFNAANLNLETASVELFSGNGMGVKNRDRPSGPAGGDGGDDTENSGSAGEHAIDNEDRKDVMLLTFSTAVKLTDIQIGWKRSGFGSDMTVLAFTGGDGSSCAGSAIAGQTYAALTTCGWNFVRQLGSVAEDVNQTLNNASVYSQYWLIGTHISDIATGSATNVQTIGSIGSATDHVKLLSVKGDPLKVPEPGVLALLGAAAFGVWATRRKG